MEIRTNYEFLGFLVFFCRTVLTSLEVTVQNKLAMNSSSPSTVSQSSDQAYDASGQAYRNYQYSERILNGKDWEGHVLNLFNLIF